MDTLAKLFSSATLVKVMRLFIFNTEDLYDNKDIAEKIKSPLKSVSYETKLLKEVGFLKPKVYSKLVVGKRGKKTITSRKKTKGWMLNQDFVYLDAIRGLLVSTELLDKKSLLRHVKRIGSIRLVTVSGVFLQESDARVDLMIVSSRPNRKIATAVINKIESEVGAEIRYTLLEPDDFLYRITVRDRLVRDVFDHPYRVLLNTMKEIELPKRGTL